MNTKNDLTHKMKIIVSLDGVLQKKITLQDIWNKHTISFIRHFRLVSLGIETTSTYYSRATVEYIALNVHCELLSAPAALPLLFVLWLKLVPEGEIQKIL